MGTGTVQKTGMPGELRTKELRVAFVVQRYGLEVTGGSELLCRVIAERMSRFHKVEVLTTCAIDYVTWKDEYKEGAGEINGVRVRRFGVDQPRDPAQFDAITAAVFGGSHTKTDEREWMKKQGPYSSRLLNYIEVNRKAYDVFVFYTYLYCTTYFGLPLVSDKAILVSTCHDEPPVYLGIFDELFQKVRNIVYLTPEEREFTQRRFYDCDLEGEVIGLGVDLIADLPQDQEWNRICQRIGNSDFILYVGRIDESKGCGDLINHFRRYAEETGNTNIKLVMMGKAVMRIPEHPQIVTTGFVSEETKRHGILNCEVMLVPSPYESLSIAALEAWVMRRPVLVNGDCAVLRGQCIRSNGGLWYTGYREFRDGLSRLLSDRDLAETLGRQGEDFVRYNYVWEEIEKKLSRMFAKIARSNREMETSYAAKA